MNEILHSLFFMTYDLVSHLESPLYLLTGSFSLSYTLMKQKEPQMF